MLEKPQDETTDEPGEEPVGDGLPELIEQEHGGAIYASGVTGNAGGDGRIPRITKDALIDAAGQANPKYMKLRDLWLDASLRLLKDKKYREAEVCQKRADAIQNAYLQYGLGGKVDISLDSNAFLDYCDRAYRTTNGTGEKHVAFLKELRSMLGHDS